MIYLQLTVLLIAVAGLLRIIARRVGIPHPVALVVGGLALAMIPGLPTLDPDPDLIFTLFIPPLLYWGALNISLRELRTFFGPIVRLATGLVIVTIAAVAVVIHFLAPGIGWMEAFVLGAIVSPPDPVAATAVLRPLGAPRDVTVILEGEGLINDATALVAYRIAVAAVVAGSFSFWSATASFAVTGIGGALVGVAAGWFIVFVRRHIRSLAVVENALSLITPFIAYLPAERLHVSGVLAVVTAGLFLSSRAPRIVPPATRLQAGAMWAMLSFVLESLIFMLIGLELPRVMVALRSHALRELLLLVLATTLACIVVRFLWVFVSIYLLDTDRRTGAANGTARWKKPFFIAWSGLRGAESLVIALALPLTVSGGAPFPSRDIIIFVTFGVICMTLVAQGLSVAPLVRRLELRGDGADEREERLARVAMTDAALGRLREIAREGRVPVDTVARMRLELQRRRRAAAQTHAERPPAAAPYELFHQLRREMSAAERARLLELAERGEIGGDVMRHLLRNQDLRDMLLDFDEEAGASEHEHLGSGDSFGEDWEDEEGA
jgi:monovalent cation/hydrogen antiporter